MKKSKLAGVALAVMTLCGVMSGAEAGVISGPINLTSESPTYEITDSNVRLGMAYSDSTTLQNNGGTFVLNPSKQNMSGWAGGNFIHTAGSTTTLNIVGNAFGFYGKISGSGDGFKMLVDNSNAVFNSTQTDKVYNVELKNGGTIGMTSGANTTLELVDLVNDGTGVINIGVSLLSDSGDKVIFSGTTPSSINIGINDSDSWITPVDPTAGHSVVFATAPNTSSMVINASYGNYTSGSYAVYTPVVENSIVGSEKQWKLTGWNSQILDNPLTFKEFIEGTGSVKPATFALSKDEIDGPNGGSANSGLASQTYTSLNINLNGHTLGTNGNQFKTIVAAGKTINLDGGTSAGTVYTNWNVADTGTLNISGITNMSGSIGGSGQVNNSGTMTINADKLATDLTNTGVVNLSGGTLTNTNTVVGGQVNIVGNVTVVAPDYIRGNKNTITSGNILNVVTGGTLHNDLTVQSGASFSCGGDIAIDSTVSVIAAGGMYYGDIYNFVQYGDINNYGELIVNSDHIPGYYMIAGDVYHNTGAKTEINLVGKINSDDISGYYSFLGGRIIGGDNNFAMTLDRAIWFVSNEPEIDAPQVDDVYNLTLKNDSFVYLMNANNMTATVSEIGVYEPQYTWVDNYSTVKFKNLKNDGTGSIYLATDLLNDVGDMVVFDGTIPSNINIHLINKNDNSGEPVSPDAGHKVRYAEARLGDVDLQVNTTLTPMYGKQSMLYTPIVEISEDDGFKCWDFVGWDQRPREGKTTTKETVDIPNILPEMEEKRLEEIHRYAVHKDVSEIGAWIRGETGRMSSDGVDFDVNVMSGGYDWAKETSNGNFFMGIGVSHGTSKADKGFVGESKNTSFSVYSSWYGRKNYDYIDVVAKYGKIDHEYDGVDFNGVGCAGDYDKNMYSVMAKYGRRFPLKNGFYVEPYGSFTYGRISSADFTDIRQNAKMHVDAIGSKNLAIGAMFGRSVKETELYFKLAYAYEFDGKIKGSVPSQDYVEESDLGGGTYKLAIGASRNLGKHNSLHLDLEKDFGGEVKRPWNVALTFRHTW